MTTGYVPKDDLKNYRMVTNDKIDKLDEQMFAARNLLKNHTEHVTKLNKQMGTKASKVQFDEVVQHCRQYALNKDLKELYNKVVPPVAAAEEISQEMQAEVDRLTNVIEQYDVNLCQRATRQDVLEVENKFRKYVKKDKFKPF